MITCINESLFSKAQVRWKIRGPKNLMGRVAYRFAVLAGRAAFQISWSKYFSLQLYFYWAELMSFFQAQPDSTEYPSNTYSTLEVQICSNRNKDTSNAPDVFWSRSNRVSNVFKQRSNCASNALQSLTQQRSIIVNYVCSKRDETMTLQIFINSNYKTDPNKK